MLYIGFVVYALGGLYFVFELLNTLQEVVMSLKTKRNVLSPVIRFALLVFNLLCLLILLIYVYVRDTGKQMQLLNRDTSFFVARSIEIEEAYFFSSLFAISLGIQMVISFNEYFIYEMAPLAWAFSKDSFILIMIFSIKLIMVVLWVF